MEDHIDSGLSPTEKNRRRVEYILGEAFTVFTILLHIVADILVWAYVIVEETMQPLTVVAGVLISLGLGGLFVVISAGRCCFFLWERDEGPSRWKLAIKSMVFVLVFMITLPLTLCCGVLQLVAAILVTVSGGANTVALLGSLVSLGAALCAPFVGAYGFNGLGSRFLCPLAYE